VTSGRVEVRESWRDVDVEARDAHQVDVHLAMRQTFTPEQCGYSDADPGRTFMYSVPVVLLMLRTALKPAVTRSGRPSQYPGTVVKQSVSWSPCLTHRPDESVWLVATGVNGFFVATAYARVRRELRPWDEHVDGARLAVSVG
jgi:hypothetical protein